MKSRGGKSQRREEKKKEDQGRQRVIRQKMQVREKVAKSRNAVFFQWFVAPEGRKVGSLKRRVQSHLARWEMKSCTTLWREAHFQVKMHKTHHVRTAVGSWGVKKVPPVVARSTFWSQNVQNTSASDRFSKLRCRKSARRCGAKHISTSKCAKHTFLGRTSAPRCGAKRVSKSKAKNWGGGALLDVQMSFFWDRRRGLCTLSKVSKTSRFCGIFNSNHHYTTPRSTTLHYSYNYNCATLTLITLHYTTLHPITLH